MKPFLLTLGIFLFLVEIFSVLPVKTENLPKKKGNYVSGIIHVHSIYSDGGGTVSEIARAAKQARRDFIILTDHNVSTARKLGEEHEYDGVDLFVEMEASTQGGHCLSFYSNSDAKDFSDAEINKLSYQHYLGEKTEKDFFIALAHPSNIKNPWLRLDRYGDGYEVMNLDSVWQQELSDSFFGFATTVLLAPLNPYLSGLRFLDFHQKDLTVWDNMNLTLGNKHFGILAHDTHSKLKLTNDTLLRWPDYLETFKLGSNLVFLKEPLSEDFSTRKKQIYSSIKEGRIAMVFDAIYPYDGTEHFIQCGENRFESGDEISNNTQCQLHLNFPEKFPYTRVIRIFKNGEVYKELTSSAVNILEKIEGSGTFRTEVWIKANSLLHIALRRDVPYAFYNPIYIR